MNIQNNIKTKQDTIGIANGIKRIAEAVGLTLGAAGSNAILEENLHPGFIITNDGFSILQKARFEDPLEEMGRNLLFDAVSRANKQSGDGSTTTTVLTNAILHQGMLAGANGMDIKRSLNELLPIIEQKIDEQKREVTLDDVEAAATISAESPELGKLIGELYQVMGYDGIVELDNSKTFDTYYQIKKGVRFSCGAISPFLFNKGALAEYSQPTILVAKTRIASINDVIPVVELVAAANKKELVIFCEDITDAVISTLIMNHVKGIFNILIIKAPVIWRDLIIEDFAKATGATVISDKTGLVWKDVKMEHLGTCEKLITTKDETTLLGIKDVSEHIAALREIGDDDSMRRVAWLNTKAAVIHLGANSDAELSYKRLKAEDAVNAARLAIEDGIVPGGGVALLNASLSLPDTLGGSILKEALKAPYAQILANANQAFMLPEGEHDGFDAKNRVFVNMWDAKIVDPAKVVKNAVRNAISVAGEALTIQIAIFQNRTEEQVAQNYIRKQQQW